MHELDQGVNSICVYVCVCVCACLGVCLFIIVLGAVPSGRQTK